MISVSPHTSLNPHPPHPEKVSRSTVPPQSGVPCPAIIKTRQFYPLSNFQAKQGQLTFLILLRIRLRPPTHKGRHGAHPRHFVGLNGPQREIAPDIRVYTREHRRPLTTAIHRQLTSPSFLSA